MAQRFRTVQLRVSRTGFADQLAAQLEEPGVRLLSEAETVQPMRRLLARLGLETQCAVHQADGSMRPTWYEAPEFWIKAWSGSETAIILREDATGPVSLRFVRRQGDTLTTTFMLGQERTP